MTQDPAIRFFYGPSQWFRACYGDITILGETTMPLPARAATWRLNGAEPEPLYIETDPGPDAPPRYPWGTKTPAVNRLRDAPGSFNVEIPVDHPALRPGDNSLEVTIDGHSAPMQFAWEPTPAALPLSSAAWQGRPLQEIGQAVDGLWEVSQTPGGAPAIRPQAPVGHDVLFVVGPSMGSQEARFTVTFGAPLSGIFLGLSDFFVAHDAQEPGLGIKPGYSTAGLITLRPNGELQAWQSMGDNTWDKPWAWVRRSRPKTVSVQPNRAYHARHQLLIGEGQMLSRCRLWPADAPEPETWQVSVDTFGLAAHFPRPARAAFALFQYHGAQTEWSDLELRALDLPLSRADRQGTPIEESPYRYVEKLQGRVRAIKRRLRRG